MNLKKIIRKEIEIPSNGKAKVKKVPKKCRLSQEGLNELKEESAGMRKNDGTLYGALDYNTNRRYWCKGISAGFTPSANLEKTQLKLEKTTDDDRDI